MYKVYCIIPSYGMSDYEFIGFSDVLWSEVKIQNCFKKTGVLYRFEKI